MRHRRYRRKGRPAGRRGSLVWAGLAALAVLLAGGAGLPDFYAPALEYEGSSGSGYYFAQENGEAGGTIPADDSSFQIHFIDVGQADAALVLCDGESMLIDGGNTDDSSLIYSYLERLELTQLDYMVCTHAHEDHAGGLSGALNYADVEVAFAPVTEYDSAAFRNFRKYLELQGKAITVPEAGDTFFLGSAQVDILGPVTETEHVNNTSIVLRIVYGETSFLFTGDAEWEEEQEILETGKTLNSTVLKVGHHGSSDSTSYQFLREVMPEYAVISVGEDNPYGHPSDKTLSRLKDAGAIVYRTDLLGDIICTSDGKTVTFETENGGTGQ